MGNPIEEDPGLHDRSRPHPAVLPSTHLSADEEIAEEIVDQQAADAPVQHSLQSQSDAIQKQLPPRNSIPKPSTRSQACTKPTAAAAAEPTAAAVKPTAAVAAVGGEWFQGFQEDKLQRQARPEAMREVFTLCDHTSTGAVGESEMRHLYHLLGLKPSQEGLRVLFAAVSTDNNKLSYTSWSKRVLKIQQLKPLLLEARMWRELFSVFDRDGEGHISAEELRFTISKLFGWRPTRYESQKLVEMVDTGGDGEIDLAEFIQMMKSAEKLRSDALTHICSCLAEVHLMFSMFDLDGGELVQPEFVITVDEFSKVLRCTGLRLETEEIQQLYSQFDEDDTGSMGFVQFADLMCSPAGESFSKVQAMLKGQYGELRQLFKLLDSDGSGSLSLEELRGILRRLGRGPSDAEFLVALECAVSNLQDLKEIEICFKGFIQFLAGTATAAQRGIQQLLREYRDMFALFDTSNDGTVSLSEFAEAMDLFGIVDIDIASIKKILLKHDDADEEVQIDFIEFLFLMTSADEELNVIKANLTGFREAFKLFDADDSGSVTHHEFLAAWRSFGFQATEEEIIAFLKSRDADGDGEMDFTEFVMAITQSQESVSGVKSDPKESQIEGFQLGVLIRSTLSEVRDAWAILDPNGDGSVVVSEIRAALIEYNIEVASAENVSKMVATIDDNSNLSIQFTELMRLMVAKSNFFDAVKHKSAPAKRQYHEVGGSLEFIRTVCALYPNERRDKDCTKLAKIVAEELSVPAIQNMRPDVSREFSRQLSLHQLLPFESVMKEDTIAQSAFIVLQGTVTVWRSKPCANTAEATLLAELREANMQALADRKHKSEADFDKLACQPLPPIIVPPNCNLSAWGVIRPRLESFMSELKAVIGVMPSTANVEVLSESSMQFSEAVHQAYNRCHTWMTMCKNTVETDFDDVCSFEFICAEARKLERDLLGLRATSDKMRKELLLRKFYVQLATCEYEYAPIQMAPPYGNEQAETFVEMLDKQRKAYIICDRSMQIKEVSEGFQKLTGYTQVDCTGKNPTNLLIGKTSGDAAQQAMHEHLSFPTAETGALAVVINNYFKDGSKFLNLLHIYPWMQQSNPGARRRRSIGAEDDWRNMKQTSLEMRRNKTLPVGDVMVCKSEGALHQWIWVLHDVSPAAEIYKVKPVLQKLLECTRKLLVILRDGHTVLQELFGKLHEEAVGWNHELKARSAINNANAGATLESRRRHLSHDDQLMGTLHPKDWLGPDIVLKEEAQLSSGSCLGGPQGALILLMNRSYALRARARDPLELLQQMPLFKSIDRSKMHRVACGMYQKIVRFSDCLVREGAEASSLFFVKKGMLRLDQQLNSKENKADRSGLMLKRRTVATIGPGDVLDETTLNGTGSVVWTCTAVADSQQVVVFEVERALVERVLETTQLHPDGFNKQRGQHRSRVIQELKTSCHSVHAPGGIMYRRPSIADDTNLGWEGGYREAALDEPVAAVAATVPAVKKRRHNERRWVRKVELHTTCGRLLTLDSGTQGGGPIADPTASYSRCGMGREDHRSSKEAKFVRRIQQLQSDQQVSNSSKNNDLLQKARDMCEKARELPSSTSTGAETRPRFAMPESRFSRMEELVANPTILLGFKNAAGHGNKRNSRRHITNQCSIPGLTRMTLQHPSTTTALNEHGLYNTAVGMAADPSRTIARWPAGKKQVVVRQVTKSSMH